jgi:hypothetical protein
VSVWASRSRPRGSGSPEPRGGTARALLSILFGGDRKLEGAPWRELRYQLITAAAGTLLQAWIDGSAAGVLLIHEFRSNETKPEQLAANQADLEAFIALLHPESATIAAGQMLGPIQIPSSALLAGGMPLYIDKAVTDLGQL